MRLHDVNQGITKHKKRKRIGRGAGSGLGKTAGRGHKGQKSRAGHSAHPTFEGGRMPLVRRVPKRGFNNRWAGTVCVVNVAELERLFDDGAEVTPESLQQAGKYSGNEDEIKILGNGELKKKLKVSAHRFSKSAQEKIEKAGGSVTVIEPRQRGPKVKNKQGSQSRSGQVDGES